MKFCDNPECKHHVHVSEGTEYMVFQEIEEGQYMRRHRPDELIRTRQHVVHRHLFSKEYMTPDRNHHLINTWLCDSCAQPLRFLISRQKEYEYQLAKKHYDHPRTTRNVQALDIPLGSPELGEADS
jgi:hypothetical protein